MVIFLYLFKCGEKMTQTIFFLRKFGLSQYLAKSYSESGIELLDFFVKYEKFNKHLTIAKYNKICRIIDRNFVGNL